MLNIAMMCCVSPLLFFVQAMLSEFTADPASAKAKEMFQQHLSKINTQEVKQ